VHGFSGLCEGILNSSVESKYEQYGLEEAGMIQLPESMVQFLHDRVVVYLGARDAQLQPRFSSCLGIHVGQDRSQITVYVLESDMQSLGPALDHNGQMALLVAEAGSHTTYQFKGELVGQYPSTEQDYAIQGLWLQKLEAMFEAQPYTQHVAARLHFRRRRPTRALTMRIREAFDQTPGPGAGRALNLAQMG
jgi:hypothetical protein